MVAEDVDVAFRHFQRKTVQGEVVLRVADAMRGAIEHFLVDPTRGVDAPLLLGAARADQVKGSAGDQSLSGCAGARRRSLVVVPR